MKQHYFTPIVSVRALDYADICTTSAPENEIEGEIKDPNWN